MQKYQEFIYVGGQPLAGASVKVTTYPGGADAVLYSDNGSSATSNPLTTDSAGFFSFYAADGRYTITVSKSGYTTRTITDVLLEDPADGSSISVTNLSVTGDVTISGNARRIYGKFTGNPQSDRTAFMASTANANTVVSLLPNGSAGTAAHRYYSNSTALSGQYLQVGAGSGALQFLGGTTVAAPSSVADFASMTFNIGASAVGGFDELMMMKPNGEMTLGGVNSSTQIIKMQANASFTRWINAMGSVAGNPGFTASGGSLDIGGSGGSVAFFGGTGGVRPTITGSRGANAALASLLTQLATLGLITDSSS